jgi:hypothetical protein
VFIDEPPKKVFQKFITLLKQADIPNAERISRVAFYLAKQPNFIDKDNSEEFVNAYYQLLLDFGKFLSANDFHWKQTTRCWNRIYFNKDGKVDYFLYQFNSELSDEMKTRFDILLNEFIKDYQLPITAEVPFSQCSPVNYQAK